MATLTIIKNDKWVCVDGYGCILDAVVLDANVHAIQWDGSAGWIEYNDGTANKTISSISDYSTITDDHATKKTLEETAAAKLLSEYEASEKTEKENIADWEDNYAALKLTYGWKRQQEYPSIGDQLDALYHAGIFDSTMTAAIKAVKDKYPKKESDLTLMAEFKTLLEYDRV
jgi:hypothetical protein